MRPVPRGATTSARMLTPLRQMLAVVFTVGAVMFTLTGLTGLIQTGPWLGLGLSYLVIVAVVMLFTRWLLTLLTRGEAHILLALVPSLLGGLSGLWLMAGRFGGAPGRFEPFPGLGHLSDLVSHVSKAQYLSAQNVAPIEPFEPIVFTAIGGALLVFVLADVLANGVRMPALAGITILPIWLPQLLLAPEMNMTAVTGACACLLALAAVDNPFRPSSRFADVSQGFFTEPGQWLALRMPTVARTITVVGVTVIGALVATSAFQTLPVWNRLQPPSIAQGSGGVRISDTLDLTRNLGPRANHVVLTYSFGSDVDPARAAEPLRSTTLTHFDGTTWRPSADGPQSNLAEWDVLWPFPNQSLHGSTRMKLTIKELSDTALPIPIDPRSILGEPGGSYDAFRDAIQLDDRTTPESQFDFLIRGRDLDPETLRSPQSGPLLVLPQAYRESVLRPALELPDTSHIDSVRELAQDLTSASPTEYDKALALQNFLRDTNTFTYSLTLPEPRTDDSVWDFLTDRTGYCVQFASTMTIMARSLGLPARVGVGFLPGEPGADGEFIVRGRNAHAWTEVFFDNVGWVRFEPTPAIQTGATPPWAPEPTAEPSQAPSVTPTQEPTPEGPEPEPSENLPDESPQATPSGGSDVDQPGAANEVRRAWVFSIVALLLAALVAAAAVVLGRRRLRTDLEGSWRRVVKRAERLGVQVESAATLRQAADQLEPVPDYLPWDSVPEDEFPVHALARELELERYAPARARSASSEAAPDGVTADARERTDRILRLQEAAISSVSRRFGRSRNGRRSG